MTLSAWVDPEYDRFTESIAREKLALYLMHGEEVDGPIGIDSFVTRPAWMADGACRGESRDLFFLNKGGDARPAKAICNRCPVRAECLEYAMSNYDLAGIWGGLANRERRRLRRLGREAS